MDVRICNACGDEKPITAFPKNGRDKHGNTRYRPDCKVCYGIKRKLDKVKHNKFITNTRNRTGENVRSTLPLEAWKDCLLYFKGRCAYCGAKQSRRTKLTKDHVVPVSKGGKTVKENIVPACMSCNCSKSNSDFEEWYAAHEYFSENSKNRIVDWMRLRK